MGSEIGSEHEELGPFAYWDARSHSRQVAPDPRELVFSPNCCSNRKERRRIKLKKAVTSLIGLLMILAIPPPAAWANSVPLGPSNIVGLQGIAINNAGTGYGTWNQFQAQFHGAMLLGGIALNGGSWALSATNNLLVGTGPAPWNTTLYLGLVMLPLNQPLYIDIFQFNNGTLLGGASTRLNWTGSSWVATHLTTTSVPEPTTWVLLGLSTLVVGMLRERLS